MRGPPSLTEGWCSDHMMISSFAKALNTRGYPMGSISQVFKARKDPNAAPGSVNYRCSATRAGRLRGRACMALKQTDAASTVTASGQQDEAVKAVLFDMDGVLCNSEQMTQRVGAETLLKVYGVKVDPEEFAAFAGMGEAYFLGGVAGKYGLKIDDINALKEVFYGIYLEKAANPTESIGLPGSTDLVRACRKAGLRVAVASSADRVKVDANLALVGFDAQKDFDAIVSADLFERLKPAPDIFLAAARELGVDPQNCVVVEDAAAGVQAARLAGMRVLGVTTTLDKDKMQAEGPDAIRPAIGQITVEDLVGLKRMHAGTVQSADSMQQDRIDSNGQASTSQNVSE